MTRIMNELRMYVCELLLNVIVKIVPKDNPSGFRLLKHIINYYDYEDRLNKLYQKGDINV